MNSGWYPWSIPLKDGFRSGPYSLRCGFSITKFSFPPFKCLFSGHSPDWFCDQNFLPFYMLDHWFLATIFLASVCTLTNVPIPYIVVYIRKCDFTCRQLICRNSRGCKVAAASTPELILTLGETSSEARLWNRPHSVNFSRGYGRFLILTKSSMWNTIGRWSESKISDTMTSETLILWWTTISSTSPFPAWELWVGHCGAEITKVATAGGKRIKTLPLSSSVRWGEMITGFEWWWWSVLSTVCLNDRFRWEWWLNSIDEWRTAFEA
jgi:hypothetical protein